MSRTATENEDVRALIAEIVRLGRTRSPRLTMAELAIRGGVRPETLSRMKKDGRGDIAVISRLAAAVGKRLSLADQSGLRERVRTGGFFDED